MSVSMAKELHENDHAAGRDAQPQMRVGVPYRSVEEEVKGYREKYEKYLQAIQLAGGKPVEISLRFSTADGFQLMNSTIVGIEEIASIWNSLGVCKTQGTLSPSGWSQASSML
jgi:hypothetical protein